MELSYGQIRAIGMPCTLLEVFFSEFAKSNEAAHYVTNIMKENRSGKVLGKFLPSGARISCRKKTKQNFPHRQKI